MTAKSALWRLAIAAAVAVFLLVLISNVIRQPVDAPLRSYTAEFTDAAGLHRDADVRVRGARVGKVQTVDLKRRDGQSVAVVTFTLDSRYGVVAATRLAIKFQALTGLRYVDAVGTAEQYSTGDLITDVPTTMTQPSLDVTELFNGLQPVFATLSPDDINAFAANAQNYLSGDGTGLKPLLESIRTLTDFVSNRQEVVSTLMNNLSGLASHMSGNSANLIQIIRWVNRPIDSAIEAMDQFRNGQLYGREFTNAAVKLIENMGFPVYPMAGFGFLDPSYFPEEMNEQNIDTAMDRAFTRLDDFTDAFKFVPVFFDNIPASPGDALAPCSHGRLQLPEQMDVLLNGQRMVVCNP